MVTYKIKQGDTLSAIAKRFNTTVDKIVSLNSSLIKDKNKIAVGWVITIPNSSKGSETVSKRYDEIGKAFEKCISDIKKLDSYKKLSSLL